MKIDYTLASLVANCPLDQFRLWLQKVSLRWLAAIESWLDLTLEAESHKTWLEHLAVGAETGVLVSAMDYGTSVEVDIQRFNRRELSVPSG